MITCRSFFGLVASGPYIYIIGGQNYIEGALIKCERFNIFTKVSQPINYLNQPSSHHSVCNYQDKFFYKLGGIKKDNNFNITLVDNILER